MHCLLFNAGTQARTEVGANRQINASGKQFFQVQFEPHVVVERGTFGEFDQHIHIAVGPSFVASDGAKDRQLPHTESPPNFGHPFGQQLDGFMDVHGASLALSSDGDSFAVSWHRCRTILANQAGVRHSRPEISPNDTARDTCYSSVAKHPNNRSNTKASNTNQSSDSTLMKIATYDESQVAIYGGGGNCTRVPDFATNSGTCGYGNCSYP